MLIAYFGLVDRGVCWTAGLAKDGYAVADVWGVAGVLAEVAAGATYGWLAA
jgi:hypothetical protein